MASETSRPVLLKAICRCNAIPTKILMTCFTELEKTILTVIQKVKRPQIPKAVLSTKSNAGGIPLPNSNYTTKPQ
jgi:hypothetical protein